MPDKPKSKEEEAAAAEYNAKMKKERETKTLLELKLTELQKSESPINKVESGEKKIETVRPWNNYTIVTLKGSNEIIIFDENAQRIKDFQKPLSDKTFSVIWSKDKILKKINKKYIAKDGHNRVKENNCSISEVPLELRGFAKKSLSQMNEDFFEPRWWHSEVMLTASDVVISPDNKYIVITSKEGGYSALLTEDENGITLAPRDWKRIDLEEEIPPELGKYAEKILGEHEGYKQLNDKYSALVTDVGINIVENEKSKGAPLFSDHVPSIERNVAVDPNNPNIIYYCQSSNPRNIVKLDLTAEPNTWGTVSADFSQKYEDIHNLQFDPTGNFFLFYSKEDLVVVTKDGLEEVKRVPKLTQVNFDASGKIRAIDSEGYLVIYEPNFDELSQEIDKQRVAKLAEGIQIGDIFDFKQAKKTEVSEEISQKLESLKITYEKQFQEVLDKMINWEGVIQIRQGLNKLRDTLRQKGLKTAEVTFVIEGLENLIKEKEKEFAVKETKEALALVKAKLSGGLSITSISEAKMQIEKIKSAEALLDIDLRQELRTVIQELEQKSVEFFSQRGSEIVKDVQGIVERTRMDLEGFTNKMQMDDWLEFRFPQLKSQLGTLAKDTPLEAEEAYRAITDARNKLQEMATKFEEKFKMEYAKVREKAVERTNATVGLLESDIEGLINRLRTKGFKDRQSAEQYLESSEAKKSIDMDIEALMGDNPEVAKELHKALKVRLSNAFTEIEQGEKNKIAETGQQMVVFGKEYFPKWEAKVKEKVARKVDLVFDEDQRTHGPGIKAGDILGDVAVNIRTSTGKIDNVRLYEGWQDENEWRLGLLSYKGESLPPSYVTANDFKKIKKDYLDWSQGESSSIQRELNEKREELQNIYKKREKIGKRTTEKDEAWKKEYKEKYKAYAEFAAEHNVLLLKRLEKIKNEPEVEYKNGKGYVPKWESHWVNDNQTEKDLENLAKKFKMQLELQEGLLNLKGHAGTGKDVRIKMFCALTNRPYFGMDCTKWTTEFELSEDVTLESNEQGPQTIKVPSTILNGINTPGAVVYFNEFNAMPEQAQIFLHALMDEKRSITLKTSSGKVVKAHPSVLLASSMNPGYAGTFEPQLATRSRIVDVEIEYPPLTRTPDNNDKNRNPIYDASEALRIARGVDSLCELTYEANLEHNEFVKMWDKYVNGLDNDSPEPNTTQKFDIDATLALVQFSNILRENFSKFFEKSKDSRNALQVSQPITGRELRRCAYMISKMTPEEKSTANPEAVAKELIKEYFLTHIDKKDEREKIFKAMNTWTSKKRIKA